MGDMTQRWVLWLRLLAAAALDDEGAVEAAAEALAECNPTPLPAASDLLAGKWQLLWSSPGSDYSRLREKLRAAPLPVPPAPAHQSFIPC